MAEREPDTDGGGSGGGSGSACAVTVAAAEVEVGAQPLCTHGGLFHPAGLAMVGSSSVALVACFAGNSVAKIDLGLGGGGLGGGSGSPTGNSIVESYTGFNR